MKFSFGKRKRFSTSAVGIAVFAVFLVYALVLIVPYLYALNVSLKTRVEYTDKPIFALPEKPMFENYLRAWKELSSENSSVPMMFLNSLWYAGGMSFFGVFFSAMAAYVVAYYEFPGRRFFYVFALVAMLLPIMGSMASSLKFAQAIGAYNSPLFALLEAGCLGGSFIILYSTFKGVSRGYAESAFIDGAGHFRVFISIMLPQVISPLCALLLADFISLWSDCEVPLIYFPNLPTLSTGLYLYQDVVKKTLEYPVYFAGLLTCMVPTVVLFSVFQNTLMDIQMGGGLKG